MAGLDDDPRIVVSPLDRSVIEKSTTLDAINEMHDREVVATTLILAEDGETVCLITCDLNITASGLVPIVW